MATKIPGVTEEDDDPVVARLTQENLARDSRLTGRLQQVITTNPDDFARKRKVGEYMGYPEAVIEAIPQLEQDARVRQITETVAESPALQRQLADDEAFAKLAHDDTVNLSGIEKAIKVTKNLGRSAYAAIPGYSEGAYGVAQSATEFGASMIDPLVGTILPENPLARMAAAAGEARQKQKAIREAMEKARGDNGLTENAIYSGVQSGVQNVLNLPLALLTRNPNVFTGTMSAQVAGQEYGEARDRGLAPSQALPFAASQGMIEYATEQIPAIKLIENLSAKQPIMKIARDFLAREIPGEQVATVLQDLNDWAVLNPEKPFSEYLAERPGAAYSTLVATVVGGSVQVGTGKALESIAGRFAVQDETAKQAQQHREALTQLDQLAATSLLRARDPATFQQFIASALEDGPVQDVYIDAKIIAEAGLVQQLAEVSPAVAAQIGEAQETGGSVRIPFDEYAAAIAGTELSQPLIDHIKLDPQGMTFAESETFQQTYRDEFTRQVNETMLAQQGDENFKASTSEVKGILKDRLNVAGHTSPDVNDTYATLASSYYAVRAAQLGISPKELYEQFPLNVVGERVTGDQLDQSVQVQGETRPLNNSQGIPIAHTRPVQEAFWSWFGDSKTTDKQGRPKVMYHGTAAKFHTFEPKQAGAIFLTENKGFAEGFSAVSKAWMQERGLDGEDNLIAAYVKADNPFDYLNPDHIDAVYAKALELNNAVKEPGRGRFERDILEPLQTPDSEFDNWHSLENKYVQQAIRELGFDSFYVAEGGQRNLAVYDSAQIKSATENEGTFDPSNPNIFKQSEADRSLIAQHNLSADKLLHAERIGGIAVPSLAITKKETPLDGFGDITLLAGPELVDPKGYAKAKVYGADIYSPRYPTVEYQFTANMKQRAEAMLKDGIEATDTRPDWDELSRGSRFGYEELARSAPFMWQFLRDKGLEPPVTRTQPKPLPSALTAFAEDGKDAYDHTRDPAFIEAAYQAQFDMYAENMGAEEAAAEIEQLKQNAAERGRSFLVEGYARDVDNYRRDLLQAGRIDREATRHALQEVVRAEGLDKEIRQSAQDFLADINPNERIFQGHTYSGNRKYIEHTLENVVKLLKKELRGGENWNYGLGSVRARFTPQFKSLAEIRKSKDKLLDKAAFEKVRTEMDTELFALVDRLGSFHSYGKEFGFADTVTGTISDAATMGIPRAIKENGFSEVPEDVQLEMAEFMTRLRNMPTEYFEVKILREVDLAEFSGAVVPEGTDPKVIETLNRRGITDIRYYEKGNEQSRAAQIATFENLFFQGQGKTRGAYSPSARTIAQLKNADLSTFLHELGHAFLDLDTDLAYRLAQKPGISEGEEQILADVDTLLTWFGMEGDTLTKLEAWRNMTIDQQRDSHEKFAEGFEAYLFEGKAPSLELQPLFQRFRSWLASVYRNLMEYLTNAGETLTPEVRAVMDRMLATPDQISTAQQARGMAPLFASAEEAGMQPEEYARYMQDNAQTSLDAISELEAKSLRDMTWTGRLKEKTVKRLNKEAARLRREMRIEARREVLQEPLYKAWQFLTGKIKPDDKLTPERRNSKELDPTRDSLLTAIAKLGGLDKEIVIKEWGTDPKDLPNSGIFGKPILRVKDGLAPDAMAERLSEHGYLAQDGHGKWDLRELEEKFDNELRGMPEYSIAYDYAAAMQLPYSNLNFDATAAGRLDRAEVFRILGDEAQVNKLAKRDMLRTDGIPADLVAQMFGYESGDALVRELAAATPLKEEIEALTDQRMLEQHGELASPEAISRAADEAIHNDVRTRIIATELAGLQKAMGSVLALSRLAKEYAAQTVGKTRIKDLRPNKFATDAARAGKRADVALKKGNRQEAIIEKRNQLVNHATTKAAYEAQAEVRKTVQAFRKITAAKVDTLKNTRNMDLVNAARAVLAEYGIGTRSQNPREYLDLVKAYDPELYAALEPDITAAQADAKDINLLTVDELRTLKDQVDSLWYLARREKQMEVDGKLVDREQVVKELGARLEELGLPDEIPGEGRAVTEADKRARMLRGVRAAARRVEAWVDRMDGGNISGAFRSYIFTPISEAADNYRTDSVKYIGRFRDLLKGIESSLKPGRIAAPELNYTFGYSKGDAGMVELLHAIGHTGNDSNKRKLLLGRGWASELEDGTLDTSRWDAFMQRMIDEGKLKKEHFDFVQGLWDLLEETKPLAQKTHREVFGRYFEEVTANEFTNQFGTYRGGYLPAITDTFEVQDAAINAAMEDANAGNAYMFPSTSRGFTKSRVEYNRPLALDLRLIPQHLDKVLLFAHLERHVRDVQRVLKAVRGKLNRYDQVAYTDMLLPWLNRSAKQIVVTPSTGWAGKAADRFFSAARSRAGMTTMFANLTNALQQVTGFSITMLKVKPTYLRQSMVQYLKGSGEMADAIAEQSPFMRDRLEQQSFQLRGEIEDFLLNPGKYEQAKAWTQRHAYFMQAMFQNTVDIISWHAAYNEALADDLTELDAVRTANAVVRETQGSLKPEDVSRWETGPAWARLFTQFASYFNMQANVLGTEFAKVSQEMGLKKGAGRAFYVFLFGFLVPVWVSEAIVQVMRGGTGDGDDEYLDEFLAFFFGAPLRALGAMVPVAGPMAIRVAGGFTPQQYDDRLATAPAIGALESAGRAPHSVYKAVLDDGPASRAIKDSLTLVSMATGIPLTPIAKPLAYVADVSEGRVEPTSEIDAIRGAITGAASTDSRR